MLDKPQSEWTAEDAAHESARQEASAPSSDLSAAAEKVAESLPPEPAVNFPKIRRPLWDVYHDDERNEIWIGVKCRFTAKGRTRENGPIEDVEMNHDGLAVVTSLDAAKQEAIIALSRDMAQLREKHARQAALKGNGILDRLTAGLGRAVNAGKSLIH